MQPLRLGFAAIVPMLLLACDRPAPGEPDSLPALTGSEPLWAVGAHGGGPPGSVVFYSARDGNPLRKIHVMNADGSGQRAITGGSGNDLWPHLSPDGRFVAFASNRTGNNEIFVADLNGGTPVNVSNHGGDDNWPRWSPNGRRIAFHSNRDGNYNLYIVNADGTDLRRVTTDAALDQWPDWSPDGKQLAFRRGVDVYVLDADGEEQNVRRLTNLTTLDQMPVWSPNGQQIAFMSLREGYPSVFLMSAEGDTPEQPAVNLTPKNPADAASAWLSRAPAWSKNGRQIYFMSFRPSTGGDVEIFVMNADGTGVTRLTYSVGEDGGPQTR
ncbi:MAG: PD40 domain-containing protein [Gemmatimonadetes bacterium]|nr:PD40 domain-containing protein [Gemmatimonadota bacterium]MBI2536810.1 PD40 domain-containing protein [Gemmatimonadota bacterium]